MFFQHLMEGIGFVIVLGPIAVGLIYFVQQREKKKSSSKRTLSREKNN
ncbi:hypothetical protein KC909_04190 [Candidatus Dojkabacteria bacterium]|uniref:Uncharacterized protein n=1 Tax=Candidatus Dojkabacteria bacterium TaxID=2099670 RepID=A0A955L5T2_9BACT|nr:hypothetical protein [Candidatus Dojkabacteria bacterium]